MWFLKIRDPGTKQLRAFTDYIKYDEIYENVFRPSMTLLHTNTISGSKKEHFKRIHGPISSFTQRV